MPDEPVIVVAATAPSIGVKEIEAEALPEFCDLRTAYTAIGSFDGICSDTVVAFKVGEGPYYDLNIYTEYLPGFTDAQTQKTLMDDHLRIDFHYGLFCGPPPRNEVSAFHARLYQDSIVLEVGVAPWPDVFDEINEVTLLSWDLHKEKYDIDCPDC
jgi:hypothetical protein